MPDRRVNPPAVSYFLCVVQYIHYSCSNRGPGEVSGRDNGGAGSSHGIATAVYYPEDNIQHLGRLDMELSQRRNPRSRCVDVLSVLVEPRAKVVPVDARNQIFDMTDVGSFNTIRPGKKARWQDGKIKSAGQALRLIDV